MAEMGVDVKRLEQALDYEILPGTEVMADAAGVEFVKGSSGVVLIPQPSSDPRDPLNWTPFWKFGCISSAVLLGFLQGFGPLSLSSQVPYYIKDFDRGVADIIRLIGYTILVLGFSNLVWVPFANQFGRRPAAIFSNIVCLGSMIWRSQATTYHSFLGACILNGIGAGPAETLPPMIISDVTFLHNRGAWMGAYWWAYFGSLMVGPVVAGKMSDQYGWQSFWHLNSALFGALILWTIFLQPETKFRRHVDIASDARDSSQDLPKHDDEQHSNPGLEKHTERHIDEHLGKGKPAARSFLPVSVFEKDMKQFLRDVLTPWYLFAFPIIHWSSFVVSWSSSCFLALNLTQSLVFSAPPYNFSAAAVGYTNLAVLGGAFIGLFTSGPSGDFLSKWSTRRNNGIREPEMRVPAILPYVVHILVGTAICSVGYQNKWDWKVIVILGYGLIGWQVASVPPMAMTYSLDSYDKVQGEFLVSMTINKNLWGYGVGEFLIPWVLSDGFIKPMMINAGLTSIFLVVGGVGIIFYGKSLRRMTKNAYIHRM